MKFLYVTTVGSTMGFFKNAIYELIRNGHTVDIATNETSSCVPSCFKQWGCKVFQIPWDRRPQSLGNFRAISQIRNLITEGDYGIVHCHTPIASAVTRFACRKASAGFPRIFYTAHGFHFFNGAPLLNWIVYYPIEKICSRWTDVLITINEEDFAFASEHFGSSQIEFLPGVGVDISKIAHLAPAQPTLKDELALCVDDHLLLSVGELNENKNHEAVLHALSILRNNTIHYAIAGRGPNKARLEATAAKLDLSPNLHLLGFRNDVLQLYKDCDAYIHPSFREGLPVSVIEALAAGTVVIGSDIRGIKDLVTDDWRFDPNNTKEMSKLIQKAIEFDASRYGPKNDLSVYESTSVIAKLCSLYFQKE